MTLIYVYMHAPSFFAGVNAFFLSENGVSYDYDLFLNWKSLIFLTLKKMKMMMIFFSSSCLFLYSSLLFYFWMNFSFVLSAFVFLLGIFFILTLVKLVLKSN